MLLNEPARKRQDRDLQKVSHGGGGKSKEKERFLSAQADAFAGAKAEEKNRPAPFEMTGWRAAGWGDERGREIPHMRSE